MFSSELEYFFSKTYFLQPKCIVEFAKNCPVNISRRRAIKWRWFLLQQSKHYCTIHNNCNNDSGIFFNAEKPVEIKGLDLKSCLT